MFAKKLLVLSLAAALCASTGAFAAEKGNEIQLSFDRTTTTPSGGDSSTNTSAYGTYGRYLTDQFLVTLGATVMDSSSAGTSFSAKGFGVGVKYYLMNSHAGDMVPFVGADYFFLTMSGDMTATMLDGKVGVAYFLTETASLDAQFIVGSQSVKVSGGQTFDQSENRILIGFTQRF